MNAKLAILLFLAPSTATLAQAGPFAQHDYDRQSGQSTHVVDRDRNYDEGVGPFSREEARAMREVWSTIREAENFHDINWRSLGLARAPGDRNARRFMAEDWGSLRRAERFDDINWRAEYRRR